MSRLPPADRALPARRGALRPPTKLRQAVVCLAALLAPWAGATTPTSPAAPTAATAAPTAAAPTSATTAEASAASATTTDRAVLMRLAASVVKVEVLRRQGGYALGSGVAVAADQVVTNCHVTRDGRAAQVLYAGQRWRADAQVVDADHDLCLLRVPGLQAQAVALGRSAALRPGDTVTALGFTGGLELSHSDGQVVGLHRMDAARVIQSDNFFSSGASGGALFDAQMRLVGILTFRLRGGQVHYFSAPAEWLDPLLDGQRLLRPVQPIPPDQLAYWQQPPATQPMFLHATVLAREQRWPELARLAARWQDADAADPQPWYLKGLALHRLRHWPESQQALEQALRLEPTWSQAWLALGLLHTDQGQLDAAHGVRRRLLTLNSNLASALGQAIATR